MAMADEYVHKISSRYLQKWLSYDLKHVEKNKFVHFRYFYFLTDFDFSKGVFGSFFVFFAKSWPKNMYCSTISRFFKGLTFFRYRMTWDDLDLYYAQAEW